MNKHTPSPWAIEMACDHNGFNRREYWISSSKGSIDIATTSGEKSEGEEFANANLLAAAPDLLEACEAMFKILNCPNGLLSFDGEVKELMVELIGSDIVRKAISKAKGEN